MTTITVGIDYRMRELQKVSAELHNERTFASPAESATSRIRLAVADGLVQLGTALGAGTRRAPAQPR